MARRTWGQKTIISNNLAIRRATDELAGARTVSDVVQILKKAFEGNDYDGFEFSFTPELPAPYGALQVHPGLQSAWRRQPESRNTGWELRLDLLSEKGEIRGCFSVTRSYTKLSLRSDIDCLTAEFAGALSAALQRAGESHVTSAGIAAVGEKRVPGIASVA